jgi:hypothetical protein
MAVLVVAIVVAVAVWRLGGDDDKAEPLSTATQETTTATTATPSPVETTTVTPSPTPTPTSTSPTCEGPDTVFNEDGTEKDSLLPDCGVAPVDDAEQQRTGLSLACGGSYPVILYKTTTTDAKTSICGRDSSGADFRLVTQPSGGDVVDLPGRYEPDLDAFVASQDGTTYTVQAYDGTLIVSKDGEKSKQVASDWISLDNEADTD